MQVTFIGSGDAFGSGGRFHTCLHVTSTNAAAEPALNCLIDLGASAFHALKLAAVDPNRIDTLLITHFHGDHFGGLPYFLLDAQFVSHRTLPLTIVGPPGLQARVEALLEACYPGFIRVERTFPLVFRPIAPGERMGIAGADVVAAQVVHDPQVGTCLGYRIEAGGKSLAYSGDTTWTDALIPLARNADLFICECYVRSRKMAIHMDYSTLAVHLPEIAARRVVLTHMSPDMLDHLDEIAHETAADGLTIAV